MCLVQLKRNPSADNGHSVAVSTPTRLLPALGLPLRAGEPGARITLTSTLHLQDKRAKLTDEEIAARKKKRTFRKFFYRGVELEKLLDLSHAELVEMFPAGIRYAAPLCVCSLSVGMNW